MSALSIEQTGAIGASLRRAREAAGVSREALGQAIDLSTSRIQQYERGWHKVYGHRKIDVIPGPMLALIATRLGTTAANVLTDAGLPEAALPSIPPMGRAEAAVASRIEDAERRSLRIDSAKGAWEDFIASLTPEAKERLLTHLASGNLQIVPVGGPPH